jgi:AhpD family alkylhydroperoxidase
MSSEPRIAPTPSDGTETDAIQRSVLAHQPELLHAFLRLYGTLWSRGGVDHATKEVARLRNARVTDCRYCRNVRFAQAREEGLTEEVVALIDEGFGESALSDRHKAVIRYADAFLVNPTGLSAELRAEMLRHFTPAEVVELTAGLALFMGFSKIAVALGQEPASMPTTIVPTPDVPDR